MVTIQHIMYLVSRAVHHRVDDAQVGDELVTALLVTDVIVATQEVQVDTHLAESILCVILCSIDRIDKVGITEMFASATDKFWCLAIPAGCYFREQPDFSGDA